MVSQFLDLCPFPKIIGIIFPLITLGNYPADKNEPHHISELSCLLRPTLVAQLVRSHLQCRRSQFYSWVRKTYWRRDRPPTPVFLGFPGGSAGKEPTCNAGDLGSIPGLGRSPGEGKGYPLQYCGLGNSMDCYSPLGHKVSDTTEQLSFHSVIKWDLPRNAGIVH